MFFLRSRSENMAVLLPGQLLGSLTLTLSVLGVRMEHLDTIPCNCRDLTPWVRISHGALFVDVFATKSH